ncbi:acyl carrier protein [Kitasatospora sp. NPDC002227]|uniref:acyl carrier protein n=1 Tax=Kitasatospora sp. NPDC002227 TaxID=3154773 RepID=UPI0033326764
MSTDQHSTEQQVTEIIAAELGIPAEQITADSHFRELPGVDSMRVLQIILKTEKAFDIEIEADVTFRIQTVGEYRALVRELAGELDREGAAAS